MPDDHPVLTAANAWAEDHDELLAACFARFEAGLSWPTLEELQRDFELAGSDIDVAAEAWKMPRVLGFAESTRLVLLVRGLSHVGAASQLLDDWCCALRLAYRLWREDSGARLTYEDVLRLLDGDRRRADAVSVVLSRERWPFGSGEGGPTDWSSEITSGVRAARSAQRATDVIAARDAVEFPAADGPVSETVPARKSMMSLKAAWRVVSYHPLWSSFIAAVLAGLLLLAVSELGGSGSSRSPAGTRSPSETTTRQPSAAQQGLGAALSWPRSAEHAGSRGARTFANPYTLASTGEPLVSNERVLVVCKVYAPAPASVVPDGYWYRLASAPWSQRYYAPANSFWNGDIPRRKPYTHNTDFKVPNCPTAG
jgi:hypothetical protein